MTNAVFPASQISAAVVGLGYVGLSPAVALGTRTATLGVDVNLEKVASYLRGEDPRGEICSESLPNARHLSFTTEASDLTLSHVIIVAVPKSFDYALRPNFEPHLSADNLGRPTRFTAKESCPDAGIAEEESAINLVNVDTPQQVDAVATIAQDTTRLDQPLPQFFHCFSPDGVGFNVNAALDRQRLTKQDHRGWRL